MKGKRLIVISVDALVYEDIEDRRDLPLYDRLIEEGTFIKSVNKIYPSLTHAVHAAIIAGEPAGVTGVTANTRFTPGVEAMPWYNDLADIRCNTLFDLTHRAGLRTAVCHWPVTAKAGEKIDYLIPELMRKDLENADGDWMRAYKSVGTTPMLMPMLKDALDRHGYDLGHPVYDEVQNECVCRIIKDFKPDVLFTHPGFVDSERHRTGLFSPFVKAAVKKSEEWIEKIIEASKEAGTFEETNFIVLSDHGHLPYSKIVKLNMLLIKEGLIKLKPEGSVKEWEAYAQSCDLSAYIHLKRPEDRELKAKVTGLLEKWQSEGLIEKIFTTDEAMKEYRLFGDFSFVLEAAEGIHFDDGLSGEAVFTEEPSEPGCGHSAHGHMPEKGPQPVLIGCGPYFEKGKVIQNGDVLKHLELFKNILDL